MPLRFLTKNHPKSKSLKIISANPTPKEKTAIILCGFFSGLKILRFFVVAKNKEVLYRRASPAPRAYRRVFRP